jgi:predicted dehydrogenase
MPRDAFAIIEKRKGLLERLIKVAVVGAGQFGANHIRIASSHPDCQLVAIVDVDGARAHAAAAPHGCAAFIHPGELAGIADAAIVAVPTGAHADVACALMDAGVDVLVEKPIAPDVASADRMISTARKNARILQVGHLERFNPAVMALEETARLPLFFEIHRMSVFSPRSLDVDVVLDLMIHDLDIVLALVDSPLDEIRAAGISILSAKVDIANVRLQFANGCVANITASRASTEKVRKLRLFQPGEYISVDYARQELLAIRVNEKREISFHPALTRKEEPLRLQFASFLESVQTRSSPKLDGVAARQTLEVALKIVAKIEEHAGVVSATLSPQWKL